MSRRVQIACLQTRPMPTIAAAIDEAVPLCREAVKEGAALLFLPEYCGGLVSDGARLRPPADVEARHAFLAAMRDFASKNKVGVQVGSIAVDTQEAKIANRGFMIAPSGEIIGRYDKIHLFDVDLPDGKSYRESDTVAAGSRAIVHDVPLVPGQDQSQVGSVRIGHSICYDLRFAQLYRDLAQEGAEILTCPAAFTKTTGEAHWHILNRARAIENTRFMVSACAVGDIPGGGASYGHSLIVDPWGRILAEGGPDGATAGGTNGGMSGSVVSAVIDLDAVQAMAARIPSLKHNPDFALHGTQRGAVA